MESAPALAPASRHSVGRFFATLGPRDRTLVARSDDFVFPRLDGPTSRWGEQAERLVGKRLFDILRRAIPMCCKGLTGLGLPRRFGCHPALHARRGGHQDRHRRHDLRWPAKDPIQQVVRDALIAFVAPWQGKRSSWHKRSVSGPESPQQGQQSSCPPRPEAELRSEPALMRMLPEEAGASTRAFDLRLRAKTVGKLCVSPSS